MIETDKIYNLDCLKGLKQLPDKSIDLIMTDPPYLIKSTRAGGDSRLARTIQPVNIMRLLNKGFKTQALSKTILLIYKIIDFFKMTSKMLYKYSPEFW